MNFQLTGTSSVIRLDDNAVIPSDPGNRDWQSYQAWLASGNSPKPVPPAPPAQIAVASAAQAIAAGIAIQSTGTPAINATYPLDNETLFDITSVAASLAEGKGFPQGMLTVQFPDITGALHSFDATSFPNWAAAVRDRIAGIKQATRAIAAGQSAAMPSGTVTIP